jgi:hypothetical protein
MMKKLLYSIAVISFVSLCIWFMVEITLGTILFFLGIYFVLALLILNEQKKTEEQMGRLFKKLVKYRENIGNLLEN